MRFLIFALIGIFGLFIPNQVKAVTDPTEVANNRYGIHIIDENNLEEAANLVNSSGGDWGYVTLVIRKDERNLPRYQQILDKMRRLHLIPIVRIATRQADGGWEKPTKDEIPGWVSFLNSLNWVTKNRYIIIGNEPNHAKEWGGEIDPEGYATYYKEFARELKEENSDFFIMPAGLDASAPTGTKTLDEIAFLRRMLEKEPDLFNYVDGWSSHSYPNPNFSGAVTALGRGTIRTYAWEIEVLRSLGIQKELPVFITETGWIHDREGKVLGVTDTSDVSSRFKQAFENVWNDERIVAVTPFVLSYQSEPFDLFSWTKDDGSFYPFYDTVRALPKVKGEPAQIHKASVHSYAVSPFTKSGTNASGYIFATNEGQSIWMEDDLRIMVDGKNVDYQLVESSVEPGTEAILIFSIPPEKEEGTYVSGIKLFYKDKLIEEELPFKIRVIKIFSPLEIMMELKNMFIRKFSIRTSVYKEMVKISDTFATI